MYDRRRPLERGNDAIRRSDIANRERSGSGRCAMEGITVGEPDDTDIVSSGYYPCSPEG